MHFYNNSQNQSRALRQAARAARRPHPVPSPASGRGGVIVALRATASPHKSGGFTLIEMMAVLVLIGVVMAIVGGRVFQNFQNAQYKAAVAQVH